MLASSSYGAQASAQRMSVAMRGARPDQVPEGPVALPVLKAQCMEPG
jgi:hypothetical protein